MAAVSFFGMGVPQASPGAYGEATAWGWVFYLGGFALLVGFWVWFSWKFHKSEILPESAAPTDVATTCDYCGRENDAGAIYCKECGTPFPQPEVEVPIEPQPA